MRVQWIIFIIGIFIWGKYVISGKSDDYVPPPQFPSTTSPIVLTLKSALDLLGLVIKIDKANAAENKITVPKNQLIPKETEFYPHQFLNKNNITTNIDVENYDKKASSDVIFCTKMMNRKQDQNYISKLEGRASCLIEKGYDSNDISYIAAKLSQ